MIQDVRAPEDGATGVEVEELNEQATHVTDGQRSGRAQPAVACCSERRQELPRRQQRVHSTYAGVADVRSLRPVWWSGHIGGASGVAV
jgi:hypothetical protein